MKLGIRSLEQVGLCIVWYDLCDTLIYYGFWNGCDTKLEKYEFVLFGMVCVLLFIVWYSLFDTLMKFGLYNK